MGLYLHKTPPKHKLGSDLAEPSHLDSGDAPNHSEVKMKTFDQDVLIYSFPAHYRGKASGHGPSTRWQQRNVAVGTAL